MKHSPCGRRTKRAGAALRPALPAPWKTYTEFGSFKADKPGGITTRMQCKLSAADGAEAEIKAS